MGPRFVKHYATGQFVELVFENRSSEGYYIVQNAYVGLKVYANKTIMFDPDMERVAVEREYLKAQLYNPNSTLWMDLDLGQPRVRVDVNNDSMIVVTRLFDNEQGKLEVSYIMRPGEYLKHNISLTSRVGVGQKYRLVNVFDGIHGTRLSYVNGTGLINEVSNVTRLLELKPPLLTVRSKSANVLSMNLRDLERLDSETGRWREADLEKVVIEPTASGLRAAIHFGSRTLRRGEGFSIDPLITTFQVQLGVDDTYEDYGLSQQNRWDDPDVEFGKWYETLGGTIHTYRTYLRWQILIPIGAVVTEASLKLKAGGGSNIQFTTNIRLINEDNCPPFNQGNPWNLGLTGNPVQWPLGE